MLQSHSVVTDWSGVLQVPCDRREELLIKGGLDPKKDLLNLTLRYNVSPSHDAPALHRHTDNGIMYAAAAR